MWFLPRDEEDADEGDGHCNEGDEPEDPWPGGELDENRADDQTQHCNPSVNLKSIKLKGRILLTVPDCARPAKRTDGTSLLRGLREDVDDQSQCRRYRQGRS